MKTVRKLIKPAIQEMTAYPVPEHACHIKLDAMENPYSWPGELKEKWLEELRGVQVNRYPPSSPESLIRKLRRSLDIPDDLGVLLGNGSDELIQLLCMSVSGPGCTLVTPEPGFVMYRLISRYLDLQYRGVSLHADTFSLDCDTMLDVIDQLEPELVFIACPNNPTGNFFDIDAITRIIRAAPGLVVIDEAYHAFSGKSFINRLSEFENVIVLRTLSKSGLAGIRLGLMIGPGECIVELNKARLPYNINILTQKTAEFILDHDNILSRQTGEICKNRDLMYGRMQSMDTVSVWPSEANFLLFRCNNTDARVVHAELDKKGILIKNMDGVHPLLHNCLRVTVGTAEENRLFLDELEQLLRVGPI